MTRWALLVWAVCAALPAVAAAQSDSNLIPAARKFTSPERFVIELRGGPYSASGDDSGAYDKFFGSDSGPFLGFQLSYISYRLPDILLVTAGGGFGWTSLSGAAVARTSGQTVDEETTLFLLPLAAVASVRLDVLARKFKFPLTVAGKVGFQWTHWDAETGGRNDASGWALGPLLGGQLALDLDVFDGAAARSMDEEWGINHSFLFFEVYHFFTTEKSLPIGGTNWVLGLGFVF
ncbi:MAG TPA: MXAN_2562 family outer membrane beta-barrel protein [Polyangiales bacterium]|nr:MXAN_2562 family outer membrane beta-barrel protein [Polyangiales bacterium]